MNLNPYWVSGFVDGEGTFYVGINKNSTMSNGFQVLPEFRIVQHKKDIKVLYALKDFFKSGVVRINHDDRYELRIRSLECINNYVISHFDKFQLMTNKKFDFIKFKRVVNLINQKNHLEIKGLKKIIEISLEMNRKNKVKAKIILDKLNQEQDIVHT